MHELNAAVFSKWSYYGFFFQKSRSGGAILYRSRALSICATYGKPRCGRGAMYSRTKNSVKEMRFFLIKNNLFSCDKSIEQVNRVEKYTCQYSVTFCFGMFCLKILLCSDLRHYCSVSDPNPEKSYDIHTRICMFLKLLYCLVCISDMTMVDDIIWNF